MKQARVVRRTTVHCPHTGRAVEIDLLMAPTGKPALVLHCSDRPDRPPACDQACRAAAEAVVGPVHALLILPPGTNVDYEID